MSSILMVLQPDASLEGEEPPTPLMPCVGDVLSLAASTTPRLDEGVDLSEGDFLVFEPGAHRSPLSSLAETVDGSMRPIMCTAL